MSRPVPRFTFLEGKRFALTVFDDCDNATIANTRPFYALLEAIGLRTTKAVWSLPSEAAGSDWTGSSTLADPDYRAFALDLDGHGFEIAWHGASMVSSARAQTMRGLEVFREAFGRYPRSFANHGANRENVYWGDARFRSRLLGVLYARAVAPNGYRSEGHIADSPYFWGDLCQKHIEYVRGFTFPALDLASVHRNILYADPATSYVSFWFSASHAPDVAAFNALIRPDRVERLRRRGGVGIVATHGAAGFVERGAVNRETRRLLERLAASDGWFVPVATLLDHLRRQGLGRAITRIERRAMEVRWVVHALRRGIGS